MPIRQNMGQDDGKFVTKPTNIVDAEFEIVDAGTQDAAYQRSAAAAASSDAERVQLGAFGDAAQPAKATPMSLPMFTMVAVLASSAAFGAGAAYAYFAAPSGSIPATANDPAQSASINGDVWGGLALADLSFEPAISNGREYMSVEGVVMNKGEQPAIIPPLRLLFGPEGQPKARYRIDRGETLKPGEQLVFTSRIPLRDTQPVGPSLEFIR